MKRLLNTSSVDDVYESLGCLLEVPSEEIKYFVLKNKFTIVDQTVEEVDLRRFENFLKKFNGDKEVNFLFDEITISHLTTRPTQDNLLNIPLYNLFHSLIEETALSSFFMKHGITFENNLNIITVNYKGNRVIWDRDFEDDSTALFVKRRLEGNINSGVDKCVNGFLFNGNVWENINVDHLLRSPEIIQHIFDLLGKGKYVSEWQDNIVPYVVTFKSNINDIVFDSNSRLNNKQKCFSIIRYCLWFLSKKLLGQWDEDYNPMIRLKDELNVPAENILSVKDVFIKTK